MKMYEDVLQQRNFCLKDRRAFTGEPAIEVTVYKDQFLGSQACFTREA